MRFFMFLLVLLVSLLTIVTFAEEVKPHKVITYTDLPFEVVSFDKNVKPILQNRCSICHYEGGKLLNLMDFKVAKENGEKVRANMISGRMPLRNLTGISDIERFIIRSWVDKGMKE